MPLSDPETSKVGDFTLLFGEGLEWDEQLHRLYFVDAGACELLWLDNGSETLNKASLPSLPSVTRLTNKPEQMLVSLEDGLYLGDTKNQKVNFLTGLPESSGLRMNDAVIDPQGRFITGNMFYDNATNPFGSYWSYCALDGWKKIDSGKGSMNGPCFSPDGKQLYITDSNAFIIYKFDYDTDTGTISNGEVFADLRPIGGCPDGAKVDSEGGLWSVAYGASKLLRFAPDGTLDRSIELPTNYPTDIIFAGKNRDIAYITTVSIELDDICPQGKLAGSLLKIEGLGVTGLARSRFLLPD